MLVLNDQVNENYIPCVRTEGGLRLVFVHAAIGQNKAVPLRTLKTLLPFSNKYC